MADPVPPAGSADTAGVIAPPPGIFAGALLLGWLIGWVIGPAGRLPFLPPTLATWLGTLLVVLAIAMFVASQVAMHHARTPVNPYQPSTALVRAGPYGFSRNPIYVAMVLLSLGIALLLGSPWMVLLLVPAVIVLRIGVIAREEAYLLRRFGDEYRRYTAEVRRWL